MSAEERKALSFVAILLGLSVVARAMNRPDPIVMSGAATVDIQDRLRQNQQVRQQVSPPARTTTSRKPPRPEGPARRTPRPIVIDNRSARPRTPEILNLNRATAAELDRLPGISPTVAERIVAYREAHGGFRTIEELDSVKGIGPAILGKVRPLVKLR